MRILLRKYDNKYYVWKDAVYENGTYHLIVDGKATPFSVHQTNILATDDDDRANLVKCMHCGAIIKNDPESIEAHFTEQEAKRNCLTCSDMIHMGDETNVAIQYTKNGDGTYHFTKECNTTLGCGYATYSPFNIDSDLAKTHCKYFQCRKRGVSKIDDVFVKYPGLFNKQITIDWLTKNGFTNKGFEGTSKNEWSVDLGLRGNTLHAVVNELGIVDHFYIHHRYDCYTAYYSEKYDKLFFVDGSRYTEEMPWGLSQAKYNNAKKIIEKLYKEATNE